MKKVIVKKSLIQGKGAFANIDFKKGDAVIDYQDCCRVISKKEFQGLSLFQRKFTSEINGKVLFFTAPARYVNHSCDPSVKSNGKADIALRDIKKGEEITTDYVSEKVPNLNLKCKCGSKNCKGKLSL